jgi:Flp pilus assembly protein TadD
LIKIDMTEALGALLAPEIFLSLVAMVAFWATIVQPENLLPEDNDPGHKDMVIYSPLILKEAAEVPAAKLLADGKPDEAIRTAGEMASKKPHDVKANLSAGNVLIKAGATDDGFRLLKRSVALAPRSRFVRMNLADQLAENKRYDDAVTQYSLISTAYPHWAKPHIALAEIYAQREQHDTAAAEYEKALETEANNGDIKKARGLELARAGNGRAGLDEYVRGDTTQLSSGPPDDVKRLIELWGSLDRAVFEIRKELTARPDEPELKLSLARALMYTGQTQDAKQLLVEARKRAPQNPTIHRNLALVMQKMGDTNLALSEFMMSINLEKSAKENKTN